MHFFVCKNLCTVFKKKYLKCFKKKLYYVQRSKHFFLFEKNVTHLYTHACRVKMFARHFGMYHGDIKNARIPH